MNITNKNRKEIITIINHYLKELFPICRSITGNGVRKTLNILQEITPLNIKEVKSGTKCYDWLIPKEWNINEGWIKNSNGDIIINFEHNNLHILNYSSPIHAFLDYDNLVKHIYTLPEFPDAIPYRTSYYEEKWGYCMSYNQLKQLNKNDIYEVFINSSLDPDGSLTYADSIKDGSSGKEILISTYCCHPSLANDNLSGLLLSSLLFNLISHYDTRHRYRLVIVPETIGAIAYLHENEDRMRNIYCGFVITTVAGEDKFSYKESFLKKHDIDIAAKLVLKVINYLHYPFTPDGSDERQYASPGFRIPTVTISKSKYYEYPEYHTSYDNLSYISADNLYSSLFLYWEIILALENNIIYKRTNDFCEYHLSKYSLYPNTGGTQNQPANLGKLKHQEFNYSVPDGGSSSGEQIDALSWLMFACDGLTSLLDISLTSGIHINILSRSAKEMVKKGLLTTII